jgi:integrase/recombinase XerD
MEMVTSNQSITFEKGFEEFISFCKVKNLSPATIKHYENMVKYIFYKFYDSEGLIGDITSKTVNDFILFCRESMNENDTTVNTNVRALRVVLNYFMKLGYMQEFKIHGVKGTKEIIETYTDAELKILLRKPDVKTCNYIEYRNWVIVNCLLGLGCRASTLINIKIEDLDFENDLVKFCHTKNRKQQLMPISISLKETLIEYLNYRNEEGVDYLFVNALVIF